MIAAITLAACSRTSDRSIHRVAILPFENLTGNPSFDWVASSASGILVSEIIGLPKVLPLQVDTVSNAYLSQATRFVHGYFTERGGALHFEMDVEDASRHKIIQTADVDGDIVTAMDVLAKQLEPGAHAFSTANPEAVEAWGRGEYERAVAIDPDFSAAWMAWVQTLASAGNTSPAIDVAAGALARPSLRSAVDRARIEVISATLRKDGDARRQALTTLARLVTTDTTLIATLAGIEMNARRFSAAAELYRNILRQDPADAAAMNSLGYAEAYAGNLDAARKALEDYVRQPGQRTNGLDSLGEAYFINGKFNDAEKYFFQAYESNAAFQGGVDLLKAAYARWLGGDLAGADAIMQRYLAARGNLHDPLLAWREAVWLYATGRPDRAIVKLRSAPPNESQLVEKQIAAWRGTISLPTDLSALKNMYEPTPPPADGLVRTFYAAALLGAGQRDEARKLLTHWPLPESGADPIWQSLVFPKFLELRRAVQMMR